MPSVPSPSMLRGWMPGKRASTVSLDAAAEPHHMEEAMRAANHILNDDLDSADRGVREGGSAFHKLGRGMVSFMRATLGFEAETMRLASEQLADAEATAADGQRQAQRDPAAYHSALYPVGAEYALCNAMAQLMAAVVAVMSESLTEGLRGFYKLRKAYITLDGIVNAENSIAKSAANSRPSTPTGASANPQKSSPRGRSSPRSATFPKSEKFKRSSLPNGFDARRTSSPSRGVTSDSDDDDEFQDADETHSVGKLAHYAGHLALDRSPAASGSDRSRSASPRRSYDEASVPAFAATPARVGGIERMLSYDASAAAAAEHPVDVFVHSGTSLCYGMLLTLLSLIPPAFGRLLAVVGFRGDRVRGLRMLWSATRYGNVNGAMAGLVLFGYYNGIVGSCDILPDAAEGDDPAAAGPGGDRHSRNEELTGYPVRRLETLLADMRARYPRSRLWQLEEARMCAVRRDLAGGLALLAQDMTSPLKQVYALAVFERGLQAMYAHEYALCAECFERSVELNNWSPGLYLFIAGAAQLQLYRAAKSAHNAKDAEMYAKKAADCWERARALAGKKKFLARQLPLEAYVAHSLAKWDTAARAAHVPALVDAVGTAPLEVMTYMWAGHRRMSAKHLKQSLAALDHVAPPVVADAVDERAMRAVLRAICLRALGQPAEARALLAREVLPLDHATLRGPLLDNWPAPVAHYETAAALWAERAALAAAAAAAAVGARGEGGGGGAAARAPGEEEKRLVREAEAQLGTAARWERYMLDARVGVRVTTGLDTVRRWRAEHDPAPAA